MAKITTALHGEKPFLPYQAQTPVVERFEFLTDVIEHQDGTEQRIQTRQTPRQFFEYSIPLQYWKKAEAFNTLYGALREEWAVPIWTEGQFVGDIANAQTVIDCNTLVYDLQPSSIAMLFSSDGDFQIVEIDSISDTQISLSSGAEERNSAYLIPVKLAYIVGNPVLPSNGRDGFANITFKIENTTLISTEAPAQYLEEDIYFDVGLKGDSAFLERVIEMREDINDFSLGLVSRSTPWLNPKYTTPYRSLLEGHPEVRNYKEFIFRRLGKYRAFWLPTFENDLRIKSTGLIETVFVVDFDSITDYVLNRTHIAIEDSGGNWHARLISNFQKIGSTSVQITIDTALNINAEEINRISYLGLNRFDADKIELRWIGNNVVNSEVITLELSP